MCFSKSKGFRQSWTLSFLSLLNIAQYDIVIFISLLGIIQYDTSFRETHYYGLNVLSVQKWLKICIWHYNNFISFIFLNISTYWEKYLSSMTGCLNAYSSTYIFISIKLTVNCEFYFKNRQNISVLHSVFSNRWLKKHYAE